MRSFWKIALGFSLISFFLAACNLVQAGEILDRGTVRNGMHSCPWGMFVTGVHIANNELLCADGYGDYSQEIVDGDDERPTVCNSMHCCPEGMAVTGIHARKNLLSCARFDPNRVGFGKAGWMARVDYDTQRQGMHACPERRPVLGIHEGENLLTCIGPGFE